MIKGPLEGVRVVDLSRGIAGPWATMMLGDLGAEVIRIEATAEGDVGRIIDGPKHNGESFYFLAFNRNKKSVVMDFKTPAGRQALIDLVRVSDVLVENFRPGSMDRMGLAYKDLKKINRRIIMWQNSGYGYSGPYKDRACYEVVAQSYSGMLDLTREATGKPPVRSAPPISDMSSGFFGTTAILAALQHRKRTGRGQLIQTTMLGACMAMLCYHYSHYFTSNEVPKAVGSGHLGLVPMAAYKCRDDYVVIATGWPRVARVIGAEWMIDDPRFATLEARVKNREEFDRILEEHLSKADARDWLEIFNEEDIPAAPVNNLKQAAEDPQVQQQKIITEVDHVLGGKIRLIDNPIRMTSIKGKHASPPPLGYHTEEVLKGLLGYSDEQIEQIRREQADNREALEHHLHKLH